MFSNLLQPPPSSSHPFIPLAGFLHAANGCRAAPPYSRSAPSLPPAPGIEPFICDSRAPGGKHSHAGKACYSSLTASCCPQTCSLLCQSIPPPSPLLSSCPACSRDSRYSMWLHSACGTSACSFQSQLSSHIPHTHFSFCVEDHSRAELLLSHLVKHTV